VIDTPSGDLGIVCSSLLAATVVVVPTVPRGDDLVGVRVTLDLVRRVAVEPRDRLRLLLIQVSTGSSGFVAQRLLRRFGEEADAFRAQIPPCDPDSLQADLPRPAHAYRAVVRELLALERSAGREGSTVLDGGRSR
jgi:cellulose biosynthesis protein BcsQ